MLFTASTKYPLFFLEWNETKSISDKSSSQLSYPKIKAIAFFNNTFCVVKVIHAPQHRRTNPRLRHDLRLDSLRVSNIVKNVQFTITNFFDVNASERCVLRGKDDGCNTASLITVRLTSYWLLLVLNIVKTSQFTTTHLFDLNATERCVLRVSILIILALVLINLQLLFNFNIYIIMIVGSLSELIEMLFRLDFTRRNVTFYVCVTYINRGWWRSHFLQL